MGACPRIWILGLKLLAKNTRLVRQAAALRDAGYDVTLVCQGPPSDRQQLLLHGVRVTVLPLGYHARREAILARLQRLTDWADRPGLVALRRAFRHLVLVQACRFLWRRWRRDGARPKDLKVLGRHCELGNLRAVYYQVTAPLVPFERARDFAAGVRALRKREATPDLVQCHDVIAMKAALAAADGDYKRILLDATEFPADRTGAIFQKLPAVRRKKIEKVDAFHLRKVTARITVGEELANALAEHYRVPAPTVVRNARRFEELAPDRRLRTDAGLSDDKVALVYAGTIRAMQGLEELIRAMALLPAHVHLVTVTLPAPPSYQQQINGLVEEAGVCDRIQFLEPRDPEDLVAYLSGGDIGVIPSQGITRNMRVSLPNRFFDLTMARLPLATCSLPDIRRLVEKYRIGTVFDETSPQDIADKITLLLDSEILAGCRRNVDLAVREMNWEAESEIYVQSVRSALSRV
jgi:glycosyltransferase involved in cell wall biosynthesis